MNYFLIDVFQGIQYLVLIRTLLSLNKRMENSLIVFK